MSGKYVHISQLDGDTPGAPWCNASGTVVVTDEPMDVTCPDCREHVRRCELHWRKPPITHEAPPINQSTLLRSAGLAAAVLDALDALERS